MNKTSTLRTISWRAPVLLGALLIAACEPSPEERLAHAEAYMAEADYRAAIIELKNAARANPEYSAARLLMARASYLIGDLQTAESEYKRALGLGEDREEVWLGFGRTLLEMGKATDAFERVIPNLDDNSTVEATHVLKGDVLIVLGNSAEAGLAYRAALELDINSPGALIGSAVLAAAEPDHSRARELIERASDTNPESPLVWRAKGNYLAARRELAGAAEAYVRSIAVESATTPLLHKFQTRVALATALMDGRRIDDAEQRLDELREDFPPHPVMQYLAGRIAFVNGDYDTAQLELQEYLARTPRDARGQALIGVVHFAQDNLRQAEMYLMQAVRANAGGETTRRLLAETLLRLDKPEQALIELQLSEAFGQQDPMLLTMLGRAEIGLGNNDEAIRYFEQSAVADPGNPALNLALAAAYLSGNRADDAIHILEAMPDVPGSLYRRETLLIGAYLREGRRDEAIEQGSNLLLRKPDDPYAFSVVGVLSNTVGDVESAERLFNRALELDPDNLGTLFNLGTMAYSKEDFARSAQIFDRLLDINPAYVTGLLWMAAALQREQRLAELRPRLMAAIQMAPGSLEPRVLLARLELAEGKPEAALAQVAEARDLFPDAQAGLHHLEGRILLQQDRTREALKSFERAVTAMPDHATYVFDLASVQLSSGDFDTAARTARVYRNLSPRDVRGLSLHVDAEIRAGAPQRAMSEVDEFLANNPDVAAAHLLAGDVQLAQGSPREALAHYEMAASKEWTRRAAFQIARARSAASVGGAAEPLSRWLSENPEDADARFLYAQLLEAAGDVDRAVGEYEYLLADGKLPAIGLNNLAWQYFLQGRSEAVELAQEAHNLDPENGSITDTLGWILFNTGETERAVRLLREAVIQSPSNAAIQDHLNFALAEK